MKNSAKGNYRKGASPRLYRHDPRKWETLCSTDTPNSGSAGIPFTPSFSALFQGRKPGTGPGTFLSVPHSHVIVKINYIFSAKIHKKQKVALDVFPFLATQTVVEIRQGNKGIELGTTFLNYRNFRLPIWKLHFNFLISLTLTLSFVVVALVLFFQDLNKYIFRIINKNL